MLVLASAAKGGAFLSAKIAAEVGWLCGLCVASGERSRSGIPGPVENLPTYDGELLHAIVNMRTWPIYAEQQIARLGGQGKTLCVTMLRNPLSRLRSLYTYARSGGEYWFRFESRMMERLSSAANLSESLNLFWSEFGREYLLQSHQFLMLNLQQGCYPARMESFSEDFEGTLAEVFAHWRIKASSSTALTKAIVDSGADLSRRSEKDQKSDPHVTANKFSPDLYQAIGKFFLDNPEISAHIDRQKNELGYT